jgi:hypothetical protein
MGELGAVTAGLGRSVILNESVARSPGFSIEEVEKNRQRQGN